MKGTSLKTSECYKCLAECLASEQADRQHAAQTFFGPAKLNLNYSKDTFQLTNFFGNIWWPQKSLNYELSYWVTKNRGFNKHGDFPGHKTNSL